MPLVVTEVTPPAAEPVSLAEARNHLRVPDDLTEDDALIAGLVAAARRVCETLASKAFVDTTFDAVYDSFPFGGGYYNRQLRQFYGAFPGAQGGTFPGFLPTNTGILTLPRAPLVSVASVTYLDGTGNPQTLDPARYAVVPGSPGRLSPAYGQIWPISYPMPGAVRVRFVAGHGPDATTTPANVKAAVLLMVGHWYEHREQVSVDVGQVVQDLPYGVAHLLAVEDTAGGYA